MVGALQIASASDLANSGEIVLKSGVDLDNIGNTGAATASSLGGNFTQTASGVLTIAANGYAGGDYSTLSVSGTASVAGTLHVDVQSGLTSSGTLASVITSSGLTNRISSVTDNSLQYAFTAVSNGNNVDLAVTDTGLTTVADAVAGVSHQSLAAARVFDQLIASGSGDMQEALTAICSSNSAAEVADKVEQTLPLLTGGSMMVTGAALASVNRVVQARIDANRGMSSGDQFYGDRNFWMKPFGSHAVQDERDGVAGYKVNTWGLATGIDAAVSPLLRLGAAFAYANGDVGSNSSTVRQGAEVDMYQLIGYGSYSLDERTELNFQADAGINQTDAHRNLSLVSAVASSSYESQTAHLGVGVGRTYPLSPRTSLTPSMRVDYTWIRDDGYSESGAGALNLNVRSRSTEALVFGVDGKLSHQVDERFSVTGNAGIGYDAMNERASVVAAYAGAAGASFTTHGIRPDPWLARAGLGMVYKTAGGAELTMRYDAEYRESFLNQTASLKMRWLF